MKYVKRVLKYLETTLELGLHYRCDNINNDNFSTIHSASSSFSKEDMCKLLHGYTDSSWADNYADATSNSGVCIMIGCC